ncbi:PREDICTED: non-specific lipid-transfer protein-like protein At2g13820 [Nelumbo nucifera]|uniref:Bifunctional inhibitor/plant lipid transfer protein/seed storage helical domain-containing protein n=2 Tax=Nelumbo nucifera TaxID=4432 RepID=A0A822XIR8_NELNU|nr:PREDICTED: non-specific lipid-transfer protein-like protein At2g13820 [Nelumbo nucifera]DAD19593.1 TPA_asm: hypothetical protein HUJ06_021056 [Nelumbo nucifera]
MDPGVIEMGLVMALVSMLCKGTGPQLGCTTVILSLAPCLSYIMGNSSTPSSWCCSQLFSVIQSQPGCLCSVLNGGAASLGVTVNPAVALALPGACSVIQTPVISNFNSSAVPATSGASPPSSSSSNGTPDSKTTPSVSTPPPGSGSRNVSTSMKGVDSSNGSSSTKSPFQLIVFLLLVGSCVSTIISS